MSSIACCKVDPNNSTLKHALVRKVQEETNLDFTRILVELKSMVYTNEKTIIDGVYQEVVVSKTAIQLNYVVLASPGEVKINADEYSRGFGQRARVTTVEHHHCSGPLLANDQIWDLERRKGTSWVVRIRGWLVLMLIFLLCYS
ncbi:hypothetical protein GGR54DRAFT_645859 [Hypoxylon sp. NC1633]|nr:hypothetical protein GGR54DRAFT_645859 [Hypoxylon sp. NC1633]